MSVVKNTKQKPLLSAGEAGLWRRHSAKVPIWYQAICINQPTIKGQHQVPWILTYVQNTEANHKLWLVRTDMYCHVLTDQRYHNRHDAAFRQRQGTHEGGDREDQPQLEFSCFRTWLLHSEDQGQTNFEIIWPSIVLLIQVSALMVPWYHIYSSLWSIQYTCIYGIYIYICVLWYYIIFHCI